MSAASANDRVFFMEQVGDGFWHDGPAGKALRSLWCRRYVQLHQNLPWNGGGVPSPRGISPSSRQPARWGHRGSMELES